MKKNILLMLLIFLLVLASCSTNKNENTIKEPSSSQIGIDESSSTNKGSTDITLTPPNLGDGSLYDSTKEIIIYLAEESTIDNNNGYVVIEDNIIWILGEGLYVLTGTLYGSVYVSAPNNKVEMELRDVKISNSTACPLLINAADSCEISANNGTTNTIIDEREEETDSFSAAIYANCDLKLKGKGTLNIENKFNNGIHTKDDLEIKNLTLNVKAVNNALKGNDSLTIESGNITAISTKGDSLKTTNTDISAKGNQRGDITILGGVLNLYAACDCIDAAYNVIIQNNPVINCYTDSFSDYSEEVSSTSSKILYLKINQSISNYRYAVLFEFEDGTTSFINAEKISSNSFQRETYLSLNMPTKIVKLQIYAFNVNSLVNSTSDYIYCSEKININTNYDCLSINKSSSSLSLSWSTYKTVQRPGGMQEGNPNKADYSCKGIKAENEIIISGGTITISSHDDAIHTTGNVTFENGNNSLGNITISGGNISIYSDDDGIHADNELNILGGTINITNSYEGIEGNIITFDGGITSLVSSDDGINASAFNQTPVIYIKSGVLYLDSLGDGIDSNGSIVMTGGYVIALGPTNAGNGVLDYDKTFTATGGFLLAIGCNGMNQDVTASGNAKSFTKTISTTINSYVILKVDNVNILIVKITKSNMNYCVASYEGTSGSVSVSTTITEELVNNLYYTNN